MIRDDDMNKETKRKLKNVAYTIAIVALGGLGVYNYGQFQQAKQSAVSSIGQVRSLQNSNQSLVKAANTPKYVVNAKGHMDYHAKATISKIKSLFSDINTWKNSKQYYVARQRSRNYVKDPQFYKQYLKNYVDSSGESSLDALNLKKRDAGTKVFEVRPGQYLVITSYYMYHNPKDFTQQSAMTTSKSVFMFYGDSYRISHAKSLTNLNSNND